MKFYIFFTLLIFSLNAHACIKDQISISEVVANRHVELSGPFTIKTLENRNMIKIRGTNKVLPFGYANKEWLEFISDIREEDEIYFTKTINRKYYMDGYILIRNGCVINFLTGRVS